MPSGVATASAAVWATVTLWRERFDRVSPRSGIGLVLNSVVSDGIQVAAGSEAIK
jgi:hypothetical protein